jgi:hypothetical protein
MAKHVPLATQRPSRSKKSPLKSAGTKKLEQGSARIVLDVPIALHQALKIRVAQERVTVKAFLLALLAEVGID